MCYLNDFYMMIFFLDNGRIIKAVNAKSADSIHDVSPVVIEELQVFESQEPVRLLNILRGVGPGSSGDRLVVMSDSQIQSLKLHRCSTDRIKSCRFLSHHHFIIIDVPLLYVLYFMHTFSECVALQDPYCAWDKIAGHCKAIDGHLLDANNYYQSIATGQHSACPQSKSSSFLHLHFSHKFMK